MAATREFSLNIDTEMPSMGKVNQGAYAVKGFIQGDTIHFVITLVKFNPVTGTGALSIVSGVGLGMVVALGAPGAVITSVTMTAPVTPDGAFTGDLPIPSNATPGASYFLDIRVSDAIGYQSFRIKGVPIEALMITSTLVPVAAPDEALGKNEAKDAYVPIDGTLFPGRGIILVSEDTTQKAILRLGNDGQLEVSPLA